MENVIFIKTHRTTRAGRGKKVWNLFVKGCGEEHPWNEIFPSTSKKTKAVEEKKTPAQPLFVLCPGTQREGDVVESEAWDLSAIPNRRGNIGKITGNIGKCH